MNFRGHTASPPLPSPIIWHEDICISINSYKNWSLPPLSPKSWDITIRILMMNMLNCQTIKYSSSNSYLSLFTWRDAGKLPTVVLGLGRWMLLSRVHGKGESIDLNQSSRPLCSWHLITPHFYCMMSYKISISCSKPLKSDKPTQFPAQDEGGPISISKDLHYRFMDIGSAILVRRSTWRGRKQKEWISEQFPFRCGLCLGWVLNWISWIWYLGGRKWVRWINPMGSPSSNEMKESLTGLLRKLFGQ